MGTTSKREVLAGFRRAVASGFITGLLAIREKAASQRRSEDTGQYTERWQCVIRKL